MLFLTVSNIIVEQTVTDALSTLTCISCVCVLILARTYLSPGRLVCVLCVFELGGSCRDCVTGRSGSRVTLDALSLYDRREKEPRTSTLCGYNVSQLINNSCSTVATYTSSSSRRCGTGLGSGSSSGSGSSLSQSAKKSFVTFCTFFFFAAVVLGASKFLQK